MAQRRIPKEWERVAVPTGAINGIDIVDVDVKHGAKGADWFWANWEGLPRTRIVVTESGGWHIFFRHHEGLKGSVQRIALGVDVRADGNYVVDWGREGLPVANGDVFAPWPEWLLAAALGQGSDAKPNAGIPIPNAGMPILPPFPSEARAKSQAHSGQQQGQTFQQPGHSIAGQGFVRTKPGSRKARLAFLQRVVEREPVGNRNGALLWAACRMAEMVLIERKTEWSECVELLVHASRMNGQWAEENGPAKVMATIASGLKLIEAQCDRTER
jgi:hypothetical protein